MMNLMRRESIDALTRTCTAFCLLVAALANARAAHAQAPEASQSAWRFTASAGGYVPLSSVIKAADTNDTRLAAGPAFSLEPQYLVNDNISVYASALLAFPTIKLGSSIQPAATGPSNQVMLGSGTVGGMFTAGAGRIRPTIRLGGGLKFYSFDLSGADDQVRPTVDVGLGVRGVGIGAIEGAFEFRYLLSSFDQGKLPTRGIAVQEQRQNDFVFSVGIGFRPH
jgi:hypothetical protein